MTKCLFVNADGVCISHQYRCLYLCLCVYVCVCVYVPYAGEYMWVNICVFTRVIRLTYVSGTWIIAAFISLMMPLTSA